MALINCPECGSQISSRAAACIKCGCPIANTTEYYGNTMQSGGYKTTNHNQTSYEQFKGDVGKVIQADDQAGGNTLVAGIIVGLILGIVTNFFTSIAIWLACYGIVIVLAFLAIFFNIFRWYLYNMIRFTISMTVFMIIGIFLSIFI